MRLDDTPLTRTEAIHGNCQRVFVLTKSEPIPVPKSAFRTEGEVTEFRALLIEKVNAGRALALASIPFQYTRDDLKAGRMLNMIHGGGWRGVAKQTARFACLIWGSFVIGGYVSRDRDPIVIAGILGLVLFAPVMRSIRSRKPVNQIPQKIYFGEEGLHFEMASGVARIAWPQFIGYLENERVFLLSHSPRLFRTIPNRIFRGSDERFRALFACKLPQFDSNSAGKGTGGAPAAPP
jgi:hypothetical protein